MTLRESAKLVSKHRSDKDPDVFFILREANFQSQMKKAVSFIRAAFTTGYFKENASLLIIGGGVSGLSAGLEAATHGMFVTLFETDRRLLSVQRKCKTRYIHPYEYQWPLPHFSKQKFPFLDEDKSFCPSQMHWQAGLASDISKKLGEQIQGGLPWNFSLKLGIKKLPLSIGTLRKRFDSNKEYDFILVCAGGRELVNMGKFSGFRYWENDPLEILDRRKIKPNILISGGGDGGLQDLLRILYRPKGKNPFSASELLNRFLPKLKQSPIFVKWMAEKQKDSKCFRPHPQTMWNELSVLFDSMAENKKYWEGLSRSVRAEINPSVLERKKTVQLIFKGSTFSGSFLLNAFLVHLLSRTVKEAKLIHPNCELDRVVSTLPSHQCCKRAKECCYMPHFASFKARGSLLRKGEEFGVIVLRHGQEPLLRGSTAKKTAKKKL